MDPLGFLSVSLTDVVSSSIFLFSPLFFIGVWQICQLAGSPFEFDSKLKVISTCLPELCFYLLKVSFPGLGRNTDFLTENLGQAVVFFSLN
jgi:hypothetical protein